MGFKAIENNNPFIFFLALFTIILIIRKSLLRRPQFSLHVHKAGIQYAMLRAFIHRRTSQLLMGLCLLSGVLTIVFEYYYRGAECAVSQRYTADNIRLVQSLIAILDAAGIQYWLDYATLLSQMRGQSINKWDHDVDVSVMYPGLVDTLHPNVQKQLKDLMQQPQTGAQTVNELFDVIKNAKLDYKWDEQRHLIQVYPNSKFTGPHLDVWLWTPSQSADERSIVLHTSEPGVAYNPRQASDIFPLQKASWTGVGEGVYVPSKPHIVSNEEFSHYGGDYMVAQVFRGDCFHNFFNLRWMYT